MSAADPNPAARLRGGRVPRPLRPIIWFWAALILASGVGAGLLQWVGAPPANPSVTAQPAAEATLKPPTPALPALRPAAIGTSTQPAATTAAKVAPGPVAAPDPALLEASRDFPGTFLPRIGADRRSPMQAYASPPTEPDERRPRIAIVLAGIGLSQQDSLAAVERLPRAVTLAVSPYASGTAILLDAARARGHELLASLPMEPASFPTDDPGEHALLTGNTEAVNRRQLEWALTRFAGYVGATSALGPGLRGDRYTQSAEAMRPVLAELGARGLLFVDARPGAPRPAQVVGRAIDLVLDDPPDAPSIDAKLASLEAIALRRGSAIGLASLPTPVTVARIAVWAHDLGTRGVALAPVSAVVPIVTPETAAAAADAPR